MSALPSVTRQRVSRHALLAALTVDAIQEGSAVVRVDPEAGRGVEATAAAADASAAAAAASAAASSDPLALPSLASFRVSSSFLCGTCRVAFEAAEELRAHAKSPWHVANMRAKTSGGGGGDSKSKPLSEAEFEEQQAQAAAATAATADRSGGAAGPDDDSASSGGDSSDDAASSSSASARRKREASADDDDCDDSDGAIGSNRVTFFTSTQTFSVWKAMLVHPSSPPSHLPLALKSAAYLSALRTLPAARQVAVIMVSGGRFSAAIFRDDALLVSKNFQRYTTRRKQGGSQSSYDSAHGAAQSIGSSIRRKETIRYWEEVARVLGDWGSQIQQCARIFLFAPGANRLLLLKALADPACGVAKADERVRNVPFPTYRPTLTEVTRIHTWLNTVEFEDRIDPPRDLELLLSAPNQEASKQESNAKSKKASAAAAASSAAAASAAASSPAVSMLDSLPAPVTDDDALNAIRDGNLIALQQLLASAYSRPIQSGARYRPLLYHAVEHGRKDIVSWLLSSDVAAAAGRALDELDHQLVCVDVDPRRIVCWGALHRACVDNAEELVLSLLSHGADPTLRDSNGRLPSALLSSAAVRLAVRRLAGSSAAMQSKWLWTAAADFPPLTSEAEDAAEEARKQKARDKRARQKEKAKLSAAEERESKEAQAKQAEEQVRQAQQAQALRDSAAAVKAAASSRAQSIGQLSDREKRAAAAERRVAGSKGTAATCALCKLALLKTPFERLDHKYCSIACLQQHKLQLDAAAAGSAAVAASKLIAHNPK